jgi:DNA-binding HxlR family transcriptional regulator
MWYPTASRYLWVTSCGATLVSVKWNVFDPACHTRQLLDRIADKWTVLVICALADDGPMRFGALRRRIGNVAPKVMTEVLRSLERDGAVSRTVYTGSPLRVEYRLTPLGKSLYQVVGSLKVWAERQIIRVEDARAAYDKAQARLK